MGLTSEQLLTHATRRVQSVLHRLVAKNAQYGRSADRLGQFHRLAAFRRQPPEQVLLGFMVKHVECLCTYIDGLPDTVPPPTAWDETIGDLIAYLLLLDGLVHASSACPVERPSPLEEPLPAGPASPGPRYEGWLSLAEDCTARVHADPTGNVCLTLYEGTRQAPILWKSLVLCRAVADSFIRFLACRPDPASVPIAGGSERRADAAASLGLGRRTVLACEDDGGLSCDFRPVLDQGRVALELWECVSDASRPEASMVCDWSLFRSFFLDLGSGTKAECRRLRCLDDRWLILDWDVSKGTRGRLDLTATLSRSSVVVKAACEWPRFLEFLDRVTDQIARLDLAVTAKGGDA